jgi:hypothetical protein
MAKERRFEKRGYLKYIHQNASGDYVYTGGYYVLNGVSYKSFLTRVFLFCLPAAACVLAAGIVPNPAMSWLGASAPTFNAFYILIPYIFELAFTGSVVWAGLRLLSNEKPLREYVYKATVPRFSLRCVLAAAAAGLVIVGETVFLILHGPKGQILSAVLAYVLHAAVIALMLLLRRYIKGTNWFFSPSGK